MQEYMVKLWKMEYRMYGEVAEQKRIKYRIWNKWQSCETQERIEYRVHRNRREQSVECSIEWNNIPENHIHVMS